MPATATRGVGVGPPRSPSLFIVGHCLFGDQFSVNWLLNVLCIMWKRLLQYLFRINSGMARRSLYQVC